MWRSVPKKPKPKAVVKSLPPTDKELQYLQFFTNYCPQDDHKVFLSQIPEDFDLLLKNGSSENADKAKGYKNEEKCPYLS